MKFYEQITEIVKEKKKRTQGKIIFLNGTSSSGKTSLARALQKELDEPFLYYSSDTFATFLPERCFQDIQLLLVEIPNLLSGFHASLPVFAKKGNNLIIDHVFQEKEWLVECIEVLKDQEVLFVGVLCDLTVLEEREKKRVDREEGQARYQSSRVHKDCVYDIEIDNSKMSPEEGAKYIKEFYDSCRVFTGFKETQKKVNVSEQSLESKS